MDDLTALQPIRHSLLSILFLQCNHCMAVAVKALQLNESAICG